MINFIDGAERGRRTLRGVLVRTVLMCCLCVGSAWSQKWETAAPIPQGAEEVYGVAAGGKLYVFGGRIGSVFIPKANNIDLVEEYDPAADRWDLKAPMPTPRSASAWGVHNGRICVAGGEIRHRDIWGAYTAVEAFAPKSNTWTRLPPMAMPRHGLAGDFIGNHFHLVSGQVQSGTNLPGLSASTDWHDVLVIGDR